MALAYHYSTAIGAWTRCQATTPDLCYYKADFHGDRTAMAVEYGGAVVSYRQDNVQKDFTITPVIEGVYIVLNRDGEARTYRADNGVLIARRDRNSHLRDEILPRMRARHYRQLNGEAAKDAPTSDTRPKPLELPMSLLTEATVRPGVAGTQARTAALEAQAQGMAGRERVPTRRELAKARKAKRKGMAASLRNLFRSRDRDKRQQVVVQDDVAQEREARVQSAVVEWFYEAFSIAR